MHLKAIYFCYFKFVQAYIFVDFNNLVPRASFTLLIDLMDAGEEGPGAGNMNTQPHLNNKYELLHKRVIKRVIFQNIENLKLYNKHR